MTAMLEMRGVSKSFAGVQALRDVSFTVEAGEIHALVGANGLGVPVVRALNPVNTALGFESGFIIVVVAILLDRMLRVKAK